MASNTGIGSGYTNTNPYAITSTVTTTPAVVNGLATYDNTVLNATNNYPLNQKVLTTPTPSTATQSVIDSSVLNTLSGVTYEQMYKNLASYKHTINMTDKKNITITYTTDINTVITVNTDMRTPGVIVSTISGDTPSGMALIKTTSIDANFNVMDVVYS